VLADKHLDITGIIPRRIIDPSRTYIRVYDIEGASDKCLRSPRPVNIVIQEDANRLAEPTDGQLAAIDDIVFRSLLFMECDSEKCRQRRERFSTVSSFDTLETGQKLIMFRPVAHTLDLTHMVVAEEWLIIKWLPPSIPDREAKPLGLRNKDTMTERSYAIGILTVFGLN
jgi:hypothetical protein